MFVKWLCTLIGFNASIECRCTLTEYSACRLSGGAHLQDFVLSVKWLCTLTGFNASIVSVYTYRIVLVD